MLNFEILPYRLIPNSYASILAKHTVRKDNFDMADLSRNAAQSTNSTAELGQLLRAYRKSRNMSQVEAAALAGVGERFLSELERGKSTAEIGKVFNVLNRFGLTLTIARRGGRPLFDDEALSDELNEPLEALS